MLLPFVARTDDERRVLLNSIGPTWEGNQVWFITAGGALFAAWPLVYAAAFSGLYWALLLVLFALFFRPVGFEYRSKVADPRWRDAWDWGLFVGGSCRPWSSAWPSEPPAGSTVHLRRVHAAILRRKLLRASTPSRS